MLGQFAFLSLLLTILTALCFGLVGATDCELNPLNPWVWGLLAGLLELGMMVLFWGMLHCALKLQQLHDEKHSRKQTHDKAMSTESLLYLAIMATPLELQRAKAMLFGTKVALGLLAPQLLWGFLGTISAFSGLSGGGGSACSAPIPLMLVILIIGALAQPFVQVTNFFEAPHTQAKPESQSAACKALTPLQKLIGGEMLWSCKGNVAALPLPPNFGETWLCRHLAARCKISCSVPEVQLAKSEVMSKMLPCWRQPFGPSPRGATGEPAWTVGKAGSGETSQQGSLPGYA
eukprot:1858016-Amphidinium_carterae.1